jgi:hypothetical protein
MRERRSDVDLAETRVREWAADDPEVDGARAAQVVDPLRLALDQRCILLAADGRADRVALLDLGAHDATASIASTMFW